MKRVLLLILLLFIIIGATIYYKSKEEVVEVQEVNPQTIHVSLSGSDENDGSEEHPFRTLSKAAKEAVAGTTVYIHEGTYEEPLEILHSGTKESPIAFQAYKQDKVIVSGAKIEDKEEDIALVSINSKNYVSIKGLILQDLTTELENATTMGLYVTGSSSHITIKNNTIRNIRTLHNDGNAHGLAVYGTEGVQDIKIQNNIVEDLKLGWSEALVINGNVEDFTIEGNTVRNNDNIGIDVIGYEGTASKHDYARNGQIINNKVYNNSSYGNPAYRDAYSAGGIYVDGGKSITIKENTVHDNDIGIEATSEHDGQYAEDITISHNIVYKNVYTGISIGGYDEERGGTKNSIITKNILYQNDTKGLDGGQLLLQYDTKNNTIEKNILTSSSSSLFIVNYFTKNEDNTLLQNIYHKEEKKKGIWVWKEEEYDNFEEFKIASNSDKKSQYIDPKYEDAENDHFQLNSDSPVSF